MDSANIENFKKFIGERLPKLTNRNFIIVLSFTFVVGISSSYFYRLHLINQEEYAMNEIRTQAYKVVFGGKILGHVRDKDIVSTTIDIMQDKLSEQQGIEIIIKQDVQFVKSRAENNQLLSNSELVRAIKDTLTYNVNGFAIKANGEIITVLESKEHANSLLNDIKTPFINRIESEESNLEDIKFLENIEIAKIEVPISKVEDYDKALTILQCGTEEEKTHIVKKGESFWSIAKKYNITVEDLEKANPDKNPKIIIPDDELSLIVPKPYLTVITYEEKTYTENIKYDTVYKNTSSLYKDETRVQKKGVNGKREVVAKIEKYNGIESNKEILAEKVIKKPSSQIVLKGTKAIPKVLGSGVFKTPTGGRLTSAFGYRWGGKFHHGIDLASKTGTPIKAADGGVVVFAGWKYPYGYMVEINHGGGFTTRYGHCSKLYVKKGDKVVARETIAAVGNTGLSTGPHVHFEVRKYGVAKNPYSYINKKYR